MTKWISGKKTLAVVLVLTVLMSCMVFSFGGTSAAEENLLWENDFNDGTSTNWLASYQSTNYAWASGKVNTTYGYATNQSVYDATNKAMAMKFIGDVSRNYMTGFVVLHKEATNGNTGEYGYNGGSDAAHQERGVFLPVKDTYTVTFDYKVESFSSTAGAAADICVGFAVYKNWYWWSSTALRQDFINATNKGVYEVAATVNASTANTWQTATVVIDKPLDDKMLMHIFSRSNDDANKNLNGTTILVDNVKVRKTEEADPLETAKRWENDFNDGTATNWLAGYQQTNRAWASGKVNDTYGYATNLSEYDATNKAMAMKFIGDTSRNYLTGFTVLHKEATNDNTGEYGYHGGVTEAGRADKGMFLPTKGTYTVSFDYKVESFSATAGAAADICVGFALYNKWYWWSSTAYRSDFVNDTNKGVYEVVATVNANTAKTWQTATVVIDKPLDDKMLMHIFSRSNDAANKNLNGTTILVDNVVVYEGDVTPKETLSTVKMWQNSFVAADSNADVDSGNWLGAYSRTDNAWSATNAPSGISATYDSANEAMNISVGSNAANESIGGFVVCHEDEVKGATGYGSVGVGQNESDQVKKYGVFHPAQGAYTVSLDYKVTEFSAVEGAAMDICVGFARTDGWNWAGNAATINGFVNSDPSNKGVYQAIATVKASDKGAEWCTATITIDQPYNDTTKGMLLNIFVRSTHGVTDKSLADSTVLIDNVKVYSTKAALDQTVNDRTAYLYEGETEQGPTNLHRYVVSGNAQPKTGVYTSMRLAAKYTAGDSTGSTIIIDGEEYTLAERGILVGKANSTLNLDNYLWSSSKTAGFDEYWVPNPVVDSEDPTEITYTLRLANMGEAWFTSPNEYVYRSYYKVLVPYVDADGSEKTETFTVYGGVSGVFTFGEYAATFQKSYWFPSLTTNS